MMQAMDYAAFEAATEPEELAEAFQKHDVPAQAFDTVVTVERDHGLGKEAVQNLAESAGWELFGIDMQEFTLSDGSWRDAL